MKKREIKPTKEEIKKYMELHNADEVGQNDKWDMETAEYHLLLDDKYYYKNQAIEALNRIDELACITAEPNHEGEAEQLEQDYNLLFDYLSNGEKLEIEIPFSEQELEELRDGKSFNWEFDGVKVKLYQDNC